MLEHEMIVVFIRLLFQSTIMANFQTLFKTDLVIIESYIRRTYKQSVIKWNDTDCGSSDFSCVGYLVMAQVKIMLKFIGF